MAATTATPAAGAASSSATAPPERRGRRAVASPMGWIIWALVVFFFLNLAGVVFSVLVNSFATTWFDSWLPQGFTAKWYGQSWSEFSLGSVIVVTLVVALVVVVVSILAGTPAAYLLARRTFPGKRALNLLFLLPVLLPPIAYGIPLATVLYKFGLGGNLSGVILANLVPAIPFVILTMTPFIEQIDPRVESAARMLGANTTTMFRRVLAPLLVPGMLAAGILVAVRTIGMFELTYLTSGPTSGTLVTVLFQQVNTPGIRAQQSVDAMAVIYTALMVVLLVIALRFVNPTQLVARVREDTD